MVRKISEAEIVAAVRELRKIAKLKKAISAKTKALMALLGITGGVGSLAASQGNAGEYWGDKIGDLEGMPGKEGNPYEDPNYSSYIPKGVLEAQDVAVPDDIPYEEPIDFPNRTRELFEAEKGLDEDMKGFEEDAALAAALDQADQGIENERLAEQVANENAFDERQAVENAPLEKILSSMKGGFLDAINTGVDYWGEGDGKEALKRMGENIPEYWGDKAGDVGDWAGDLFKDKYEGLSAREIQQKIEDDAYQREIDRIGEDDAEESGMDINDILSNITNARRQAPLPVM